MKKVKKRDYFAIFLSIGLIIGCFVIQISRDISIDYNVWIKGFKSDSYKKGDYVIMSLTPPHFDAYVENKRLIKQVICVSGDFLEKFEGSFYCNKVKVATTLEYDKNGNKLPIFNFSGKVPNGYYFVTGTHERSYDSRYFGLINHKNIENRLYPLF